MKTAAHRSLPFITRSACALWAAAFLFFLIYSAPHQVHHFFEQVPRAHQHDGDHDHPHKDSGHGSSAETKCVFQISANRCHAALAWQGASVALPLLLAPLPLFNVTTGHSTDLAATFHIRAPPLA